MPKKSAKSAPVENPVVAILEKATGTPVGPYQKVRIDECAPNDWNPNEMTQEIREKLTAGITKLLELVGVIPPIIVRPHPNPKKAKYEIIDGFHRWDILRAEGHEVIDAYVIDVDTKMAMILTDTLNYLRGEPDADRYVKYLHRLLTETPTSVEEAAVYLPESSEEIKDILAKYELQVEHITVPDEEDEEDDENDPMNDQLMELKFHVHKPQAEIIEQEIARISSLLKGKNVRGRALEYMAVNSRLTPLEDIDVGVGVQPQAKDDTTDEDEDAPVEMKAKLRRKASS